MPSVFNRVKDFFEKESKTSVTELNIILEYAREHRLLAEMHAWENAALVEEKENEIMKRSNETGRLTQEYNLKLLKLLARQKQEREEFNMLHSNVNYRHN